MGDDLVRLALDLTLLALELGEGRLGVRMRSARSSSFEARNLWTPR
jgi:hypothetical protein